MKIKEVNINVRTSVSPQEILYCVADVNYTRIYYNDRVEIIPVTLKKVEARLESYSFFRIHKSYLVNINFISERKDKYQVEMSNKHFLDISRRKVVEFKKVLKNANLNFK